MRGRDHKGLGVQVKIASDRMDQWLRYLVQLFNVCEDEGVLADQVDDARDSAARPVDSGDGIVGKYPFEVPAISRRWAI